MYSTCYHCLAPLGRNVAIEPFPVGRRVAFDAVRSRLWAVCLQCGRWNLAPLDDQEAALARCERLYRAARRRYGTANIGLAELSDGTELVRVGAALRPELAAWRYGGRLLRRRPHRAFGALGAGVLFRAAAGCATAGAHARRWVTGAAGPDTAAEQGLRFVLARPGRHAERVLAVARPGTGPASRAAWAAAPVIRRRHLADAVLVRPDLGESWRLEIPHEQGLVRLSGVGGLRTAAALLAAVNVHGVTAEAVTAALGKLDEAADPDGYFNRVLRTAWRWRWGRSGVRAAEGAGDPASTEDVPAAAPEEHAAARLAVSLTGRAFWANGVLGSAARQPLVRTPLVDRLALEMAAHEDVERAALAHTLAGLEQAWREAEELAQIVDTL